MKEQLEQQLQAEFPFMKQNRVEEERNTYRRWGCECSAGWYSLIRAMCQSIADRYAVEGASIDIVPLQLKEKFAALRFYYSFEGEPYHIAAFDSLNGTSIRFEMGIDTNDEKKNKLRRDIAKIVRSYEEKSRTVCEYCGNEESAIIRKNMRWKKTLCETCYRKYLENTRRDKRNYRKEDFL